MFCNQCEQTRGGFGCSFGAICGKPPGVSDLFDLLLWQIKGIAAVHEQARKADKADPEVDRFIIEGLFITVTNVNFDGQRVIDFVLQADAMMDRAAAAAGMDRGAAEMPESAAFRTEGLDAHALLAEGQRHPIIAFHPDVDIQSLMQLLTYQAIVD